ncbi:hypothetical protein HMPREF1984_02036 [Leptotrichia sp. oral taxon 215 str. W9775]|uniref:YiiX/YebB-like N1pC/P60 family cysteine hydrolase n=1 Tax=Leptotrichia sp. oral taxon 215 TaxID=712359 RepID=UPI0003AE52FA|nr:YiiX/YebB-like N1pC/P60 family cysteine hydrolase [Leptotrichia sp. oral taxon 215]ERK65770.1 hypothetical protein HMPREF1984_02036 [Leptotrichia sp. oral taxon 215 str. W9775]
MVKVMISDIKTIKNNKTFIRQLLIAILLTFLVISCQSIDPKYKWYQPEEVISKVDQLQPGDILILSKEPTIRSMWGHSAILNEEKKIVEFPSYSAGYSESPIYAWSKLKRKIAIFRLKNIDDKFRSALFNEIDKTVTKPYGLTFDKNFDKRLYCSQFVYLVFKNAGKNTGRNVDLDSDGGGWVMPFDIMESPLLENIVLE